VVVAAGRHQAPRLPIIARAATQDGVGQLHRLGAQDVILPELEGGLEIMRHTLLQLGYPTTDVDQYAEAVRRDRYDISVSTPDERGALDQLLRASRALGIAWFCISEGSSLIDQPLSEVRLNTNRRSRIIAVLRDGQLIAHPEPGFRLRSNDLVSVIGESGASEGVDGSDGVAIGSLSSSLALEDVLNRPLKPLEAENIAEPGHPEPR
jgi:CPA2 family monovalent cation:H+ antiporter-2